MRDVCILADETTKTYYAVSSTFVPASEGRGRPAVHAYTSKDLITWEGPHIIFQTPEGFWGDAKHSRHLGAGNARLQRQVLPVRNLRHRFKTRPSSGTTGCRGSNAARQVLVGDSPLGPFKPFQNHSTLPADMMTLDGTLWIEDGIPWMIFCHEWVQIKDGTVEMMQLKDDLSETVGEPVHLFDGSDAPWNRKSPQYHCFVTDGPTCFVRRAESCS